MTLTEQARLLSELKVDEGCRLSAYLDSMDLWTIGYGRMIDERKGGGISADEASYLLENDIKKLEIELAHNPWFSDQDEVRQAALLNMAFNLGVTGLYRFPKFLMHMGNLEYQAAVAQLAGTPWHKEVGARADRIIQQILTGVWI